MSKVQKYTEYLRISFLTMLAYRARYFIGISTYIIYISVYYFIWKAIFENGTTIGNYNLPQMVTYITVGWIARSFYYNRLDAEIAQKVVKGDLALDLLKPVDFQWMQYSRTFGESIFRLFLFTLPTVIVACFFFHIQLPHYPFTYVLFFLSTLLSLFLYTSLNYIVGLFAIPLQNIEGLIYAKSSLLLFFSGLIIPFDLLPPIVHKIMNILPFGGISYIPLQIYLEKLSTRDIFLAFGNQILWVIALHYLGRMIYSNFTKKIIIQGG